MTFRKTKSEVAICPFFIWTSEDIVQNENDLSLSFCNHPKNPDDYEGNCQEKICPLLTK